VELAVGNEGELTYKGKMMERRERIRGGRERLGARRKDPAGPPKSIYPLKLLGRGALEGQRDAKKKNHGRRTIQMKLITPEKNQIVPG